MKQYEVLSSENLELPCEEPAIIKTHLDEQVNHRMEHSCLKSKGHVKNEDLRIFMCPKKNSKSENGLSIKLSKTIENVSRSKGAVNHSISECPNSATIKQQYKGSSTTKAKSYDDSQHRLRQQENHGASKLTVEISMMLRKLSEMHSHEISISNHNNQEFFPAEECDQSVDDIEMIDHNLLVTMKDVSPAEEKY